jgi:energy-coupling factor transporter ATP-binding protein EcfA2
MAEEVRMHESAATEGGDAPQADATIWDELNAWGQVLPDWQRFIVSHAVRDGQLSDERVEEAYRLFVREKELDNGNEDLPEIPASVTGRASAVVSPLILRELRSLKCVNAIPESACINFDPKLTVIYGQNGAGKSGFARVLSSACFSRSSPQIIANIYDENASDSPASAEFVIEEAGESGEVQFAVGDEHANLRRISVFDSSVARIHLAGENELGFQPAGFDVFDETVRVIGLIVAKLEADIAARTRPNKFDQLFTDEGTVAEKITGLNAASDLAELRTLSVFGEPEQNRLAEVVRREKELLANSPAEMLKALAAAKVDIEALQKKVDEIGATLGKDTVTVARNLLDAHKAAVLGAVKAGSDTVSHPKLTQTGSDTWDSFVFANRALGQLESDTYPTEGDPCLLCHRPLDAPSAALIRRMWSYLDHEARAAAVAADKAVSEYVEELREKDVNLLPPDSRIRADLSKMSPTLITEIDEASAVFAARRDLLAKALDDGQADQLPSDDLELPTEVLANALEEIVLQEAALRDGEFDKLTAQLKAEHITLRQRQVLSKNIDDVVTFVEDMKWSAKARDAKPNPRFVTDKQRALFQTLIEGAYKNRLKEECGKLDCSLPVEFKARGAAGRTLRGLKAKGGHKPDEIFSEGEQRALALADFLTEVNLNPASAAVVFDDPVTSLDHERKRAIAARLVEEAAARQVVVFTHDLVFLTMLSDVAETADVSCLGHWVERKGDVPGYVNVDETPANTRVYRKTSKANEFLTRAREASGREKVDLVRSGAGALRRTIEEVVVFHLFKDTVRRWNEQIRLGCIRKINWSNELADEVIALQDETSRLLEGHSNSEEFAGAMPDVDELAKLIARVDKLIDVAKVERA